MGRRGPPLGSPLRRLPAVHDVDGLPGHLVAAEFEDLDAVAPGAVVADPELRRPQIPPPTHAAPADPAPRGRIVAPPLPEVFDALEPLPRLRELQDGVVAM